MIEPDGLCFSFFRLMKLPSTTENSLEQQTCKVFPTGKVCNRFIANHYLVLIAGFSGVLNWHIKQKNKKKMTIKPKERKGAN